MLAVYPQARRHVDDFRKRCRSFAVPVCHDCDVSFLFVPLTLGLAFLLAIMETTYVISGKQIYKDMTQFWGKLFGINFALGVTTGLTMEFQFGTNWAYYSHYVGDIFGAPLAIEGLMAFSLNQPLLACFSLDGTNYLKFNTLLSRGSSRLVPICQHCGF